MIATLAQRSFGVDTVFLSVSGPKGLRINLEPEPPIECFTDRDLNKHGHSSHFDRVFVVEDTSNDPEFSDHLFVTGYSDIRFYAELSIRESNDVQIALFRIMHSQPKHFGEPEREMFRLFGNIIRNALEDQARRHQSLIETPGLVQSISQTQDLFLNNIDCKPACNHLLKSLLSLTNSRMGFIGEVCHDSMGEPSLKLLALSGESKCPHGIALLRGIQNEGMVFEHLDNLLGAAISQGKWFFRRMSQWTQNKVDCPKVTPQSRLIWGFPCFPVNP